MPLLGNRHVSGYAVRPGVKKLRRAKVKLLERATGWTRARCLRETRGKTLAEVRALAQREGLDPLLVLGARFALKLRAGERSAGPGSGGPGSST